MTEGVVIPADAVVALLQVVCGVLDRIADAFAVDI